VAEVTTSSTPWWKPSSDVAKHVALALGAGAVVFLVDVQATVNLSSYANAGVDAALVVLAALGVGYAKRQAP
jgi:hypothetical protein